mmetsp:Transcript_9494/g.19234  ORF Transcript_9494/g.19234 Transcript_9494/m.19234 type:complete len:228 (-) Transcript_9494:356-1039(-)
MIATMMKSIAITALAIAGSTSAYTTPKKPSKCSSRQAFVRTCTSTIASVAFLQTTTFANPSPVLAFDGAGSSAYAGKSPTSKAELQKSYKNRVVADVKDFKKLGAAIDNGVTEGKAWVDFFIEYQRREADSNGRSYAAYVDLVGNKELSGCGVLLASSFAKAGKPAENLPSVKKYKALAKTFDPIKAAGAKGDVAKAKAAWGKTKDALEEYLAEVELPPSISDPIYD